MFLKELKWISRDAILQLKKSFNVLNITTHAFYDFLRSLPSRQKKNCSLHFLTEWES